MTPILNFAPVELRFESSNSKLHLFNVTYDF